MNEIELRHLHCVVTLAEERNFGRAAARLHMSQPPLTRLISEVERVVGAKLFERTTRRVALTPTGAVFVAEARSVLERSEMAMETIRAAVRRESGQLRLAYVSLALMTVLPQVVSTLREREHDVSVDLVELSAEAQREALRGGHVDMGFADEPMESEGFASLLLRRELLGIVLSESHLRAGNRAFHFGDLKHETLILHPRREYPRYYDRVVAACEASGFTPKIYHREARQNCLALVTAGRGLLLSPAKSAQDFAAGLRCVPLEDTPTMLRSEVWAVFPVAPGSPHLEALRGVVRGMAEVAPPGVDAAV